MARKIKSKDAGPEAGAPRESASAVGTGDSPDEWVEFHVLRTDEAADGSLEIFESGGGRLIRVAKKDREIIGTDRLRLRRGAFKIEL